MTERLSLGTAFFNLVGGRRQDSSETFRVVSELASHSGDPLGFYAVSEASPPGPMGARARRLVLDVVQDELAARFDLSPGARLKHAVARSNQALREEFGGHVQVGLTVLLSAQDSVYLLQVPPGQAYVLHDGTLHSVSPTQQGEEISFAGALGTQGEPYVCLFRDSIEPGDVILLTTSWMATAMDPDDLRGAFAEEGARRLVRSLFELSRQLGATELTCVALQAEAETVPEQSEVSMPRQAAVQPRTVWEHVDDAVDSLGYVLDWARQELAPPARPRMGRAATNPAASLPSVTASESASFGSASAPIATLDAPDDEPVLEDIPVAQGVLGWTEEHLTDELPVVPPSAGTADGFPAADGWAADENGSELDQVNSFIRDTADIHSIAPPPVQAFPDTTISPERIYADTRTASTRNREGYGDLAGIREHVPGRRARARRAGRRQRTSLSSIPPAMLLWSGVGVALVLLIILLVALVSGGSDYYGGARAEADHALTAYQAGSLSRANHDLTKAWKEVYLAQKNHDSSAAAAFKYVQTQADIIHGVFRPPPSPMVAFTARRTRPSQVVTGSKDLFVLDSGRRQIWYVDPADPKAGSHKVGGSGNANTNTGNGQTTFGSPKFLTSTYPGYGAFPDGNEAIALDRHFNVLANDPTPGTALLTVQHLTPPSSASRVAAVTMWHGYLYFVDRGTGQIYRYVGSGENYQPFACSFSTTQACDSQSPESRLQKPDPALRAASGIGVARGTILVALRGGRLLKFGGDPKTGACCFPLSFRIRGLRVPFKHATQVLVRDGLDLIFLVNASASKIVELTLSGGYVRTLIPPVSQPMRGMTVSSDGSTIYFVSGRELYGVPVAPHR